MQRPSATTSEHNKTARAYIYTIFDLPETDAEVERDLKDLSESGETKLVTGQIERGESTGRRHLQLYVEWLKPVRGKRLFKLLGLEHGGGWYACLPSLQATFSC